MTDALMPAFHVMAKPTGARCNLDCAYCFFLKKERLYPGSTFRMSDEVLEAYIRQTIEAHQVPEVTIAWQGGEPTLMGLDFFRKAVELEKKYARPGVSHREHAPDQRCPARRRMVPVPTREPVPCRAEPGRSSRASRRLPARQAGRLGVRQGGRGGPAHAEAPGGVQHPLHGQRGEQPPPAGGLPLLPRRAARPVPPVHPHRRARQRDGRPGGDRPHRPLGRTGRSTGAS